MNKNTNPEDFFKLLAQNKERLKELAAINHTTSIIKEGKPIAETLHQFCMILPDAWQYPQFTTARVKYDNMEFQTSGFSETQWNQIQEFECLDKSKGTIEIFYTREFPYEYEGPFLKEERDLIINLANIITGYINSILGKDIIKETQQKQRKKSEKDTESKHLLQKFINQHNVDRDIYHDLMPFKVQEILLIATLYNVYSIEREDRLTDNILGEYSKMSLSSVPRITGVSTLEEAMEKLEEKYFNLIIIMMGADTVTPLEMSKKIKSEYSHIPLYLLVNNNLIVNEMDKNPMAIKNIDKVFVWNGDPKVFFSMIKLLEDRVNIENDTRVGLTSVILLVEDSPKYYSKYLPLLYTNVLEQTKRVIEDVTIDDLYKVLRIRIRPKIVLAGTYEEAINLFERYKNYLLCMISDVKFYKDGILNDQAGTMLVSNIRKELPNLPIILQSYDQSNEEMAFKMNVSFINKNSESLLIEIKNFLSNYLGFGDFIFRDANGNPITIASTMEEFERVLQKIPDESLYYHAQKNHFSMWLSARGEIRVAKIIHPSKIDDFSGPDELRSYLHQTLRRYRQEKRRGKIVNFDKDWKVEESNIVSLADGSFGGKGRGLSFINTLIYTFDITQYIPDINLKTPRTSIIGTQEFESFMINNDLYSKVSRSVDFEEIKRHFLNAELSDQLKIRLDKLLQIYSRPLAVRSSASLEDSIMQPFAGIFETTLLPNNNPDIKIRLKDLMNGIKLVYASVFSDNAKAYIRAINFNIEEERMAVVIQEVVGNQFGDYYYPHISGVAQSRNFYPFGHIKPEDGFANIAFGLGKYVVEGERAYRFCPKYPSLMNYTITDLSKNSQTSFLAVDLRQREIDLYKEEDAGLVRLDIYEAEKNKSLKHCASVHDPQNNTISPGLERSGPRVIDFANVLKYNYIPLASSIQVILDIVEEALGSPCEIEFAVDLNKDSNYKASFFLLQIKPLMGNTLEYKIDRNSIEWNKTILLSNNAMGNGLITHVEDVVYIKKGSFDKSRTPEMAEQINKINNNLYSEGRQCLLIGPGRWGTRDRWIGIPVAWPQISQAKVIVETSFEDFPLDASSGSHFFHNVIAMNVGYCSVDDKAHDSLIAWELLDSMPAEFETEFFRHVRFDAPLTIKMDGSQQLMVVSL